MKEIEILKSNFHMDQLPYFFRIDDDPDPIYSLQSSSLSREITPHYIPTLQGFPFHSCSALGRVIWLRQWRYSKYAVSRGLWFYPEILV